MFGTKKRKVLTWSAISSILLFTSCSSPKDQSLTGFTINGETQGTTYTVIIAEEESSVTKDEIDALFREFDSVLSTYIPSSVISKLNNCESDTTIVDETGYLEYCYSKSTEIAKLTDGQFDPTVFPLVKGWGFMSDMTSPLTKQEVDSILNFVGFDRLNASFSDQAGTFSKSHPFVKLDFNAIAQGYSVDLLAKFLESKGVENYYAEIGGELVVKGKNREREKWSIGIDLPKENLEQRTLENILYLSDKAVATSGNYRKFYEKDGVKYAHTLNPKTGFPVTHSLLSATVVADDCITADAYATAFMVMGAEKTIEFVKNHPELHLEVYLLVANGDEDYQRIMSDQFDGYLNP